MARLALLFCAIVLAACGSVAPQMHSAAALPSHTTPRGELRMANLFTPDAGWVLTTTGVYTSSDAGKTWADVTPPTGPRMPLETAFFLDQHHAWAVVRSPQVDMAHDSVPLDIFSSRDGGHTWTRHHSDTLATRLDTPGPVYLTFTDDTHGWVVVDLGSHAGFMYFIAYRTIDGGVTWSKAAFPQSTPVVFINATDGFSAYGQPGPLQTGTFVSHDGGESWSRLTVPPAGGTAATYFQLPIFSDTANGVLAGWVDDPVRGGAVAEAFYRSSNGGSSWTFAANVANPDANTSAGPASSLGPASWMASFYTTGATRLAITRDAGRTWAWLTTLLPGALSQPISWSGSTAWAITTQSGCRGFKTNCYRETGLYATPDAGKTWAQLLISPNGP
jgi:photosystem II stability/assembly factor-like uncharacterized protein